MTEALAKDQSQTVIHPGSSGPVSARQTDIGTIPDGWDVQPLAQLLDFQNGFNAEKSSYGTGVPFANVLEVITKSHLTEGDIPGRVAVNANQLQAFLVRPGDILFNRTSETQDELGLASVYAGRTQIIFGGFVIRGRMKSNRLDATFAGYVLRAPAVRKQIVSKGQGAVRANIGQSELGSVMITLPPVREQAAIAEALDDSNALIRQLESLISKKLQIKQAAMQELLSGRRRLPDFKGAWVSTALAELATIRSGGTPSTTRPEYWDGNVLWCTPTDITALKGRKYLRTTARTISAAGLASSSAEIIPPMSVIMTSRATIGECAINVEALSTNQGFKNLIPYKNTDSEFLYYLLSMQTNRLMALCGGSTFLEIGKTQLYNFSVDVPPSTDEQRAISAVLSEMDSEIEALETRLSKARQIKQGMMQELLTGRVRLV